jgi:hypothetical protein
VKNAVIAVLPGLILLFAGGCEPTQFVGAPADSNKSPAGLAVYTPFAPASVDISPLTELSPAENSRLQVKAFVSLIDASGSQIKWPAVFRFELYQHITRLTHTKGQRLFIWPDMNLTAATANNEYWQDFLRAYEFNLELPAPAADELVLYVTCFCPSGKRISAEFTLKNTR